MPKRKNKPLCKGCYKRPARWPEQDPRFCTQRCAADWAYAMSENDKWEPSSTDLREYDWEE